MFLYGGSKPPPYAQNPNIANKQNKNYTSVFRNALATHGSRD